MAALTRIFNNQIYNSTIIGYQKIAAGTITGSLFASNVTVPGDLLIAGNLFVLGSSAYTTIASTNTYVNDPLVTLNNGFSGTNNRDIGLVLNRGTDQNQAIVWAEPFKEFRLIGTTETGTTYGNVVASTYANLHVGNIGVDYAIRANSITVNTAISSTSLNLTGNLLAAAGVFNTLTVNGNETVTGFLNVTGNILALTADIGGLETTGVVYANSTLTSTTTTTGAVIIVGGTGIGGNLNIGTVGAVSGAFHTVRGNISQTTSGGAVYFNTSGNVMAAQGSFGSINSTGYINTSGNISTAQLNAGQINTTGNVLATTGVFNSLTLNGNATVSGFVNATGNILSTGAIHNSLNVNGNASLGLAGAISGSWTTIVGNITQTSSGGAVYFNTTGNVLAAVGQFGSINSTGYINTSGNISTAQLNAGQINTTGNVLATAGVFNGLTVNGNESVTGFLNVTGNILGATGILSSLTVNGNESVTGFLNVTGNILGATGTLGVLGVNNSLWANASIATTAQGIGAIVVPNGGISVAGNANIAGITTIGGATQLNNTLTVGGIESITNTTNATEATGSSGALQIKGGASIARDLFIGGNIYAANIFSTTYQVLTIQDPLVYFDAANTFPYNYDIGFYSNFIGPNPIDNTGNVYQHSGVVRDNSDNTWKFFSNVRTEPSGSSITFDVNTIYDPVRAGNLTLTYTQAAVNTTTGALQVAGGAGIAGNLVAGQINSTGNVLGQAATFNTLTVNGNTAVTGGLNITGNILASTVQGSFLTASTMAVGNISAVTIGNSGATVTGTTGSFGAVNSGFIGNTGTSFSGANINLSGNILASSILTNFLSADDVVFGNVSAAVFGNVGAIFTGANINLSGNVLAASGIYNYLDVNGNVDLGLVGAISGSWINIRGNITQTSSGGAVYFNTTGNVSAAVGVFGAINSTGYINTSGNISTPQLNAGQVNTTGNVLASTVRGSFLTASTVAVGNISAVTIGNAGATVTGTTGAFSGNVIGGLAQFAAINSTPIGNATASTGAFTTLRASEGIWANSTTASTTTTTGAIVVAGGVGIAGNIRVGGGAVINNSQTADPFQLKGVATTSLIYADTAYGALVFGGSNVSPQLGSVVKFNSTDSILLPVGTSSQRPSVTGNIDVTGMLRYNTTVNNLEYYDGSSWQTPGTTYSTITDRQFVGNVGGGFGNVDGTNKVFTIQANSTTASTLVSINGVLQFPVLAYSVSGTTLTFVEPPAPEDVIDVRVITTTISVGGLASGNGLNQFIADDVNGAEIWTGSTSTFKRVVVDPAGDINILTGSKLTYNNSSVNIVANNTPYVIATWNQTAYTTAKYLVSAKRGTTNYQSMECLITTDQAGNAYITTYAVVSNGTEMGGLTANVVGGNVQLYFTTTTNITNANVKAFGTYIV